MKILLPTDCSDLSGIALKAANELAEKFNAEIVALKVVYAPVDAVFNKDGDLVTDDEEFDSSGLEREFENAPKEVTDWANEYGIRVTPMVKMGLLIDTILSVIESLNVDLVVMNSDSTKGLKKLVHGPLIERIVLTSKAPVITIKEQFNGFKTLGFANNFRRTNVEIGIIKKIQEAFESTLHLVRVNTPKKFMSENEAKKGMQEFSEKHNLKNNVFHCINGKTIDGALSDFCKIYKIDMMAMGSRQRTGFSSMVKGCPSKELVNSLEFPVLTFQSIK